MEIPPHIKSYLGQKFHRLTVVGLHGFDDKRNSIWECLCECGKTAHYKGHHLKAVKSCGCWKVECTRARFTKHGENKNPGERTNLYSRWIDMNRRCAPDYKQANRYFERGIRVCEEWKQFIPFRDYVMSALGPCPKPERKFSIDRINNNAGYEPGNIRWATSKTQCRNKENNRPIEYKGETKTIAEWAEKFGFKDSFIRSRIDGGMTIAEAIETPRKRIRRDHLLPPPVSATITQ